MCSVICSNTECKKRLHKSSHNYTQLVFLALHCTLQISNVRCQRFNMANVQNDFFFKDIYYTDSIYKVYKDEL